MKIDEKESELKEKYNEEKKKLNKNFNKEIIQKREELEKQLADLEKKRKDLLIEEGLAFICRCGKYVEDPENKNQLCLRCLSNIQTKKRRADVENRLKGAQITNLVFKYDEEMTEIIVNKDGVSYKLAIIQ